MIIISYAKASGQFWQTLKGRKIYQCFNVQVETQVQATVMSIQYVIVL